jgi:NADH-ubiquinone oxidoreductase chain 4
VYIFFLPRGHSFYIFFKSSLIPTLFLILGWGYQPERVQAGIYLLFYTLLTSLPLLVGILFVYNSLGSLCLFTLCGSSSLTSGLFYVCIIFAFLNFYSPHIISKTDLPQLGGQPYI